MECVAVRQLPSPGKVNYVVTLSAKHLVDVGFFSNRPVRHDARLAGKGAGPHSPRARGCRGDAGADSSWGGPANTLNVEGSTLGLIV